MARLREFAHSRLRGIKYDFLTRVGEPAGVILQAARQLRSSRMVVSQSAQTSHEDQVQQFTRAWQRLEPPRPSIALEIVPRDSEQEIHQIELGTGPEGGSTDPPITRTSTPRFGDGL